MLKAILTDFDGTLVYRDILDVVCAIAGKEKESEALNKEFQAGIKSGRSTLIERINFLRGVALTQIKQKLDENPYLTNGAKEWLQYLKNHQIKTILYSGNIEPILLYYQELLGIDYIVGTKPKIENDTIVGLSETDFPQGNWKLDGIKEIIKKLGIKPEETLSIGDSLADRPIFEFAAKSIAINPKHGIDKETDFVIVSDLRNAIPIVNKINYA